MTHAGGRPTDYTPEKADYICEVIASSAKAITELCEIDDAFPHESNFYKWLLKYPEFREKYLEAKEIQGIAYSERVMRDAYTCPPISEEIQLATHQFRVTQWHVSKLAPKQFGEKKEIKNETTLIVHEDRLKELE